MLWVGKKMDFARAWSWYMEGLLESNLSKNFDAQIYYVVLLKQGERRRKRDSDLDQ